MVHYFLFSRRLRFAIDILYCPLGPNLLETQLLVVGEGCQSVLELAATLAVADGTLLRDGRGGEIAVRGCDSGEFENFCSGGPSALGVRTVDTPGEAGRHVTHRLAIGSDPFPSPLQVCEPRRLHATTQGQKTNYTEQTSCSCDLILPVVRL